MIIVCIGNYIQSGTRISPPEPGNESIMYFLRIFVMQKAPKRSEPSRGLLTCGSRICTTKKLYILAVTLKNKFRDLKSLF